jgi:hypothetical protein
VFKQQEMSEAEKLRRVSYEAKEADWQKSKQAWKKDNPTDTIHRHKELYIKGIIDTLPWENYEPVETPMPLEQWNQMIEEAEKEVTKESDPKKKTLSYIMRERNQQVKKEHQED